jgi:hypothetical protein
MVFYGLAQSENNYFHPVVIPFIFNSWRQIVQLSKQLLKPKLNFGLIFVIRTGNKSK